MSKVGPALAEPGRSRTVSPMAICFRTARVSLLLPQFTAHPHYSVTLLLFPPSPAPDGQVWKFRRQLY